MAYSTSILVRSRLDEESKNSFVVFNSNDVSILVDSIETRVRVEDVERLLSWASSFGLIEPNELVVFEKAVAEFIGAALTSGVNNVTIPRGIVDYIAVLMYYRGERWCISKLREVISK